MCVARAYLKQEQGKELLMEEIALMRCEGDGLLLRDIFGEEKSVRAEIKEVDFVASKILLEKPLA